MAEPLKVGLAGLGTVGTAVVALLEHERDKLVARCGRPIEVVAVTARSRGKKRGVDLKKVRWAADPVELAGDAGIDVLVEVIGGAGDPAKQAVETALAAGKPVVTANKALLAAHGHKLATLAERKHAALNFEASVAGGIPIVKTLREGLNGNSFTRIYGILNGTCNYILRAWRMSEFVRGLPARSAAARLCRGRSDLRHRRPRHRAEAFHPGEPRLRHQSRSGGGLCGGHLVDLARRSRCRCRARLPCKASRRRACAPKRASSSACIPPWCRRNPPSRR